MPDLSLDETDQAILRVLQEDARSNTNTDISDRVGVSASTVGKRVQDLEARGVIQGYYPQVDYESVGLPFTVLFVCTTSITEREALIERTLSIDGVVNVRELMTGTGNVHVLVTGASNEDITTVAKVIDDLGYDVEDKVLLKREYNRPCTFFRTPEVTEAEG